MKRDKMHWYSWDVERETLLPNKSNFGDAVIKCACTNCWFSLFSCMRVPPRGITQKQLNWVCVSREIIHCLACRQCERRIKTKNSQSVNAPRRVCPRRQTIFRRPRLSPVYEWVSECNSSWYSQKNRVPSFVGCVPKSVAAAAAAAATRPFDQWCEIKSFTPLQLIAIASRPASRNAKNEQRVSKQHTSRLWSWSSVVFDIASHHWPKATVVSRAPRPAQHTAPFKTRIFNKARHHHVSFLNLILFQLLQNL